MYHNLLPPALIYPGVGFPYFSYPDSLKCGLDVFPNPHFVPSLYYLPPTISGIYQGHITPSRG